MFEPLSGAQISRRSLLGIIGGTAGAFAVGSVLAACASSPTEGGGNTLDGVLSQQIPTSLDPFTNSATSAAWCSGPAHDWLEFYGTDGQLYASLASSVEQASPTVIRYRLHPNVSFHDGSPVDGNAVAALFAWVADERNGAWLQSRIAMSTIEVVDDLTFDIVLDEPDAAFRSVLARLPIVSVRSMGQQANSPSGCGPFRFTNWVKGSSVSFDRDPGHRAAAAIPIEAITIRHFADSNAATQAFTSGQLNWCFPASLPQARLLRDRADAGEFEFESLEQGVCYLAINTRSPGFSDTRVREAIRLTIDRQKIVTSAFNGVGRPFFAFVAPESPFYSSGLEYQRDVAAARRLMAESGTTVPRARIHTPNIDYFQGMSTVLKENLREIGIDVDIQVEDVAATIERAFNTKEFDLLVLGDALEPEVSTLLDYYVKSDGSRNVGQYNNREVDRLLARGREQTVEAERAATYAQAMQIAFIDDTAIVPVTTEALPLLTRNSNFDEVTAGGIAYWKWPLAQIG